MKPPLFDPDKILVPMIRYASRRDREASVAMISGTLEIVELDGGFYVRDTLGKGGDGRGLWPVPFDTPEAATIFRNDLIVAVVDGVDNEATGPSEIFEFYNLAGRILRTIAAHKGDDAALARRIALETFQCPCAPDTGT